MSAPAKKQDRFHFLDGFRGIAIAMVVFAHAFMANILKVIDSFHIPYIGHLFTDFISSGLDLFFVLSGMVILRPYLRRERKFEVWDYIKRRMKRLYPPYFFALIFGAFVVWFNNAFPTWYNERGMRMEFSWLETLKEAGIVNINAMYYNLAWWSLNVEIVFYILVPLIILLFPLPHKLSDRKLYTILGFSLVGTVALQFFCTYNFPIVFNFTHIATNIGMFMEFPVCFMMGAFLATRDLEMKHAKVFLTVGGLLVVGSVFYVPFIGMRYSPFAHTGYGVLSGGLIIMGHKIKSFRDFWSKPIFVWLGERSYSLYLVHLSVFYLTDNLVSHITPERNIYYGILTRGICIPMSFFAAMLLFHFVERKYTKGLVTANIFWPFPLSKLAEAVHGERPAKANAPIANQ